VVIQSTAAFLALAALATAPAGSGPIRGLEVDPAEVRLRGSDSTAQVVVTGLGEKGLSTDLTHASTTRFESLDPKVAGVDADGLVRTAGDGEARVVVHNGALTATVRVIVDDFANRRPVHFAGEVVPILSKLGCNSGSCHGKASGQNGFRLSLLGFDPRFDYEALVRDSRGRRVFPAAPRSSLVLLKPTASIPHGGGRRFAVGSAEYRTIERWVAQGMPFESGKEPALERISVSPERRLIPRRSGQQLRVTAHYAGGGTADVTRLAQFQSNAADLATVDETGRVTTLDGVGEAAVMARFGGQVGVARATVPLGVDLPPWEPPPSRNFIDPLVFGKLRELGIPPCETCTDAEFARRSSLDICGILPSPDEVARFEKDADADKRAKWVDRLLERPEYADLFAMKWSAILKNKRSLGPLSQAGTFAFHAWIRQSIAENKPYDRFVAEILTARGDPMVNPPVVWYRQENMLEEQVDDTAQLFLGMRIQCARCHHHPFERWSPDDYYGMAAIFSRVGRKPGADPVTPRIYLTARGQATDPTTRKQYHPRVLGGRELKDLGPYQDPRGELAGWLRRPDNPFFAKALVNRYWKHFLGRGLVEPEDDMRVSNPPSNPELLDALADDFVRHGYDLKHLVRTIATSRAYDRSSLPNEWNGNDRQNFARFYPRRLPAEVLLDAIGVATGSAETFNGLPKSFHATQLPDEGFDSTAQFLEVFGRPKRESVCECERTSEANLSQSLHLLNSSEIERKLDNKESRAARWAADTRPDAEKVDELYRVCYSRLPTADEREVCLAHLARRRTEGKLRQGYEDLVWTLINTKEFLFNQ
jgi:hypothetical protein